MVTLKRGHLSWFWYPTHNIGTYLGRGALVMRHVLWHPLFKIKGGQQGVKLKIENCRWTTTCPSQRPGQTSATATFRRPRLPGLSLSRSYRSREYYMPNPNPKCQAARSESILIMQIKKKLHKESFFLIIK